MSETAAASPGGHNLPPGIDSLRDEINRLASEESAIGDERWRETEGLRKRQVLEKHEIDIRHEAELGHCDARFAERQKPLRLQIGALLLQARTHFDTGRAFEAWCLAEVKRSRSEVYACMKLAKSADPEAAAEAEKTRARDGMRATRAARQSVTADVTDKPVNIIVPFVPSGGFTPRPLTPAADRPTMPGPAADREHRRCDLLSPAEPTIAGVSCPMIEIPAADQATVEKFADQYLEVFDLIGETLIRRWWTTASAAQRRVLVDLVMELMPKATSPDRQARLLRGFRKSRKIVAPN